MKKADVFKGKQNIYYEDEDFILIHDDVFNALKNIKTSSINVIFADPPYFLSSCGIGCNAGKQVKVDKGEWDKPLSFHDKNKFNSKWIRMCRRILDKDGTIWISGTFHNIYDIGVNLEKNGYFLLNNITWQKTNPPPNLGCRCFTHSTETVLWAKKSKKSKHVYNYWDMKEENGDKQMKDVWSGSTVTKSEKSFGKHPTQKPEYLMNRIIKCSTINDFIVLDPFCGSGTTGVACLNYGCKFIGIDNDINSLEIAKNRLINKKENM